MRQFEVHIFGSESHVTANLSDGFDLSTGIAAVMVQLVIHEQVVKPFFKWFKRDWSTGTKYCDGYTEHGAGVRGPDVFYDQTNQAGAMLERTTLIGKRSSALVSNGFPTERSLLRFHQRPPS